VKNKSLRAKDFKPGALPRGPAGTRGPQGAGPRRPAGAARPERTGEGLCLQCEQLRFAQGSPGQLPSRQEAIDANYVIAGGKTGTAPDALLDVGWTNSAPRGIGLLSAYETDVIADPWRAFLTVLCADTTP
jgi:hypothetical protein